MVAALIIGDGTIEGYGCVHVCVGDTEANCVASVSST